MIRVKQKGDFKKIDSFLTKCSKACKSIDLNKYGREGVVALKAATPFDSGETSNAWFYKTSNKGGQIKISFYNSNIQNGMPIAIILQYGHATKNGGWVEGRDYINPAIRPIFDKIAKNVWKEVACK